VQLSLPLGFRSPKVSALQELFPDEGASKELPVPKLFRYSAPNAESNAASAPACWTSDIRTDANLQPVLINAVSGTASSKPITLHNQPQKRIPTVAATGPILTRVAINFRNKHIRAHDMEQENGQSDDNIWSRCVELKERRS
jgi:hypothetical protein